MATPVHQETRGKVTILTLSHGKVQALDLTLVEALSAALDRAGDAPLVLTGTGSAFSAGVDLKQLLDGGDGYVDRFLPAMNAMFVRLFHYPGPVVAAINGHAIAGGCILAAACDARIMAAGATIGVPELRVGVPFPVAPLEIMRYAVGDPHLQVLAYRGRNYDAEAARSLGLVDEVVPADQVPAAALDTAERLSAGPRDRFRLTKAQLRRPTLDRIARDAPLADPDVIAAWKAPATHAAIRSYLEALKR